MYVKAYFKDGHYGDWIPSIYYNFSSHSSNSIASDNSFIEVTDPSQAQAVLYSCDHSAVVRSSDCLISKANFGDDLYKHGLSAMCSVNGMRFFKYVNPNSAHAKGVDEGCLPAGPNCSVSCSVSGTYNGSNSMNTFNTVSTFFNTANVSCSQADHFEWTVTGGSVVSDNCSNSSCSSFYFYLNSGQSVTYKIEAFDACDNFISSKNATFYRNSTGGGGGGGSWFMAPALEDLENAQNILKSLKEDATSTELGDQDFPELVENKQVSFTYFPNPASDYLTIQIQQEGQHIISMVNIKGQEVYRSQNLNGFARNEINLIDLESGIYFIQILNSSGERLYQEKVIVKK